MITAKIVLTIILAIIYTAMLFTNRGWHKRQKVFEGFWKSQFHKDGSYKKYGKLIFIVEFIILMVIVWVVF